MDGCRDPILRQNALGDCTIARAVIRLDPVMSDNSGEAKFSGLRGTVVVVQHATGEVDSPRLQLNHE